MRIATKEYKVYRYNELSKEAMENVDRWYLETYHTTEDFSTMVRDTLDDVYELEDLDFQYSLNFCQGDGFNLYGKIEFLDILERIKDNLTESEIEYLKKADDIADFYEFDLLRNDRSSFCRAFEMDIYDYMVDCLENEIEENEIDFIINKDILKKFDKLAKEYFENICGMFEKSGYNYFYEIDREEADPFLDDMEFLADGTVWND